MSQVIANPEEIEKFARMLNKFNQDLTNNRRVLQAQFRSLGETWRDQQHAKFAMEFEQLMLFLEKFARSSEEQVPLLLKKAEKLKEFLRSR